MRPLYKRGIVQPETVSKAYAVKMAGAGGISGKTDRRGGLDEPSTRIVREGWQAVPETGQGVGLTAAE